VSSAISPKIAVSTVSSSMVARAAPNASHAVTAPDHLALAGAVETK